MQALTRKRWLIILLIVTAVTAIGLWQVFSPPPLPQGISVGNGRLEATEVDVATKVAGRLTGVLAREGDNVEKDRILANLNADDIAAQLRAAEAQAKQAQAAISEAQAGVASAASQQKLAHLTLQRSERLVQKGFISAARLDQDQSQLKTTHAGSSAAQERVREAQAALAAAEARADVLRVAVNDTALKAPIAGRVLYRLAEPGTVLAPGSKVLTLLDLNDVYMSIYLPAEEAGKITLGSPARILLDALPGQALPAQVVFVAPRAQFTPKEVETRSEREKLMFRVKIQVDAAWLSTHANLAKPGMPGIAYVQTAPDAAWPK